MIDVSTAWYGCESVLEDIIERFQIPPILAIEFGVFNGYSTAAIANYFEQVFGVDTFIGDAMSGSCSFPETASNLKDFPNVELFEQDFQSFIRDNAIQSDLIHVDIFHTFDDTYACGKWAAEHSDVVLFHDTISYPEVYRAVAQIAHDTGMIFYNWEEGYGLGILSRRHL
jgi:hypothetical protein